MRKLKAQSIQRLKWLIDRRNPWVRINDRSHRLNRDVKYRRVTGEVGTVTGITIIESPTNQKASRK